MNQVDEIIKRLESDYHLDEDHGWKILLKRLEKCEALCEYANHTYPCSVLDGGNKCTCGYDAARAALEAK